MISNQIQNIKDFLIKLPMIHSTEFEYLRKPLYTPNDQYYNNQWYLPAINSNDAWNLWTNNYEIPGNQNIILASVDLGVNYSHPDLQNNIWQNLGEDADGDGRTIEGTVQIGILIQAILMELMMMIGIIIPIHSLMI